MPTPTDPGAPTPLDDEIARRQADLAVELREARSSTNLLHRRLSTIERDYVRLTEAVAMRNRAAAPAPPPEAPAPPPPAEQRPSPAPPTRRPVSPLPRPAPRPPDEPLPPAAAVPRPPAPPDASERRGAGEYADLLGARLLAWVGGAITALGVVLMFVFAIDRGWITPELRVGFGALASALVFFAGLALRRRYGGVYSALAAVGAGIAGGYATLLAAAVLYGLVSGSAALLVAGAIAAVGTITALAWRSEIVAGIGLIGAMLVPLAVLPESGITALGTAFVALVFAGTASVATRLGWPRLLSLGLLASLVQIVALLLADPSGRTGALVVLAAVFALLYATAAIDFQRALGLAGLAGLPATLVVASGSVATIAGARLTGDGSVGPLVTEGLVFAVAALGYCAVAAVLYGLVRARSLGVLFSSVGLALGSHALAELLSGRTLAVAFAIQAVLLAWLAQRVSDRRFQLGSFAYLGLAAGHAVFVDAPARYFSEPDVHPAVGTPSLLAAALAAFGVAHFSRAWAHRRDEGGGLRFLDPLIADLTDLSRGIRWALWAGGLAAVAYAASLGVLEAGQWLGDDVDSSFAWSHVAVSVLLAAAGLTAALLPVARQRNFVTGAALAVLGTAAVKVATFDLERLADDPRGVSAVVVGTILAVAAFALVRRSPRYGAVLGLVMLGLALPLEVTGSLILTLDVDLQGADGFGLALLALAAGHAALAALSFARVYGRDHSTAQGFVALALAAASIHALLDGTPRTLALAGVAAALAALAVALRERRLLAGALAYNVLAAVYALSVQGPPAHLFAEQVHPGAGVPALLAGLGAAVALLAAERRTRDAVRRLPEGVERVVAALVPLWLWGLAVGAVYTASLWILELAEFLLPGSVEADFQRGHTAVSAFWALLGVALLYAGLVQRRRVLRSAGFVALGVTVAKIFVYDLANLTSATRSVSFLAVGALLLLGGFFYQRLAAAAAERHNGSPA